MGVALLTVGRWSETSFEHDSSYLMIPKALLPRLARRL